MKNTEVKIMKKLAFSVAVLLVWLAAPVHAAPYQVDRKNTSIKFNVRHMVIAWVRGQFEDFSGDFNFDPETREITDADLILKVRSIDSKHSRRDKELMTPRFFYAYKFPEISFHQTGFEKTEDGKLKVTGNLTIKDQTRPVTLTGEYLGSIENEEGREVVGFTARGTVTREQFGLKWDVFTSDGSLVIGNEVEILLDVYGTQQSQKAEKPAKESRTEAKKAAL